MRATPDTTPAVLPGPEALGRGAVIDASRPPPPLPAALAAAPRVLVDADVLAAPAETVALLHRHWLARERVVIELAVDPAALRAPESTDLAPHEVGAGHEFARERLAHLVWANSYDLRGAHPIWWHGEIACRSAGARATEDGVGDVRLPDGRAAWVDGGPRGPLAVALAGADGLTLVHRESVALLARLTPTPTTLPPEADGRAAEVLGTLAPDQHAAVVHRVGPARVIAPAGSGKTRVLAARLVHLVRDRGIEPELITAVAYNKRAADELSARVRAALGGATPPAVRTLHSLALSVCRLERDRRILGERDVRDILGRLVRLPRVPNQDPMAAWIEALSEVRLGLRDPADVEAERDDVDGFAEVYEQYRRLLDDEGLLDFDEQVHHAIEVLLTRPDLRRDAQRATTHLLIDEFQDLTPAFMLLVRLLAGPSLSVFAVGDDDQTIYGYAGADPRYLVDFDQWFPGAAHHALEVNHRAPPAVVDAAATLLGHNRVRVEKTIRAGRSGPTDALVTRALDATASATHVVAHLRELLARPVEPTAIAVLARVNSALLPVQVALTEEGVAHSAPLTSDVMRRTGVRTALAYLRLAEAPERPTRADLEDTLRRPARRLRSALDPLFKRSRPPTLDELRRFRSQLEGDQRARLERYIADIDMLRSVRDVGADTAALLAIVREDIGVGEALDVLDASRRGGEGSSHGDDLDALAQVATLHPDPTTFARWLAERLDVPSTPGGIVLSTVHKVKGMEWDHVIVVGADQGRFPHRLADDLEEERRVFHVAITRAREHLLVVSDVARPSPFVAEMSTPAPPVTAETARTPSRAAGAPPPPSRTAAPDRARRSASTATPGDGAVVSLDADGEALFGELRRWRTTTAKTLGLPAYIVLHDRTLATIAERRPTTLAELAACPGIGPAKLERHGDDLLAVIADHLG